MTRLIDKDKKKDDDKKKQQVFIVLLILFMLVLVPFIAYTLGTYRNIRKTKLKNQKDEEYVNEVIKKQSQLNSKIREIQKSKAEALKREREEEEKARRFVLHGITREEKFS